MSLQETKQHLTQLLGDADNRVIALSGKWGTGKSHLWREVKEESKDPTVNTAIYISLFGLGEMNQLKLKAVQSAIPKVGTNSAAMESVRTAIRGAKKVLESVHKGFAALDEVALLVVPGLLSGKVIVLDDIERKHEKLGIEEVLGFIDEFTQQYDARFVLILNDDQLAKREVWDTLREKVIDQEIRLLTTPEEAFRIAVNLTPSSYSDWIKKAVEACDLNNIRVIRKVIRAVNRILGGRQLEDAVLARVVPSIVLLSGINFKGIENGPDFQFVLATGSESDWNDRQADKNKEPDEDDKRKAKWRLLLKELGITSCDEFEALVVEFLESGQFDAGAVSTIVERYAAETDAMQAREKSREFMKRLVWDYHLSEAEVVEQAKELVPIARHMDPYIATELCLALTPLPGGQDVGEAIVRGWLDWFRTQQHEDINDENPFDRPLHREISAEFATIKAKAQSKTTLFDTCKYIVKHNGWGTREEVVMKTATAAEFESTIRSLDVDDLRFLMRRMLDMRIKRQTYETHFGAATDRFVEACRNIVSDSASARLGTLIKRLFKDANLASEVNLPATPIAADPAGPTAPLSQGGA
ncbi:P-loop NTPase fold protein [Paraburkholderia sp. CNPSo 3076]|uniref:P-loop NTPase fold protein n=1 Tax=Paraburkholderia sp. CNPSo 3076 TaxID=2940936 RepID=UPI002254CBD9|nr:P-loop NTPase fold protein [Paraburkholderia sp. CNPSo 3076]MCX5543044.1 P-loop NTPase fold protein [Paraburkholderia sp. CNPSo 3076]